MTKEEILINIEKLSELRANYNCFNDKEEPFYHALSLGIKGIQALEKEPCEDAESVRQELLDRGGEMISFRQLVERFDEVEDEYKGAPWNLRQIYNNFNILIGEKPCEDCISRSEAIKCVNGDFYEDADEVVYSSCRRIAHLPSVQPKQKTGRWVKTTGENGITSAIRCSECGFEDNRYMLFRYCPNCGAKMEVEE